MNDWLRPSRDPNQLALIPEPVEHLGPEPPPPPPGPIRDAQACAEQEGWIPEDSASCLYVSAGVDTRPLTYLRPEVIPEELVADRHLPRFFVFVDLNEPATDELALEFEDGRTRVETIAWHRVNHEAWDTASLLRVRVNSDRYAERDYAVLRVKTENWRFFEDALAEAWSPEWFIGIRDQCGPCTNVLDPREESVPLRLGIQYWLTEHFAGQALTDETWHRLHPIGHSIPVADGRHLREVWTWPQWPAAYAPDRWVSLFHLE